MGRLVARSGRIADAQPGIVALHAVTTTNALRHAFEASGNDETRRWLMLQNASFVTLFRDALRGRGKVGDVRIDTLQPLDPTTKGDESVAEMFAAIGTDRMTAVRKVLGYIAADGDPRAVMDAGRLLVFFKGSDSHDYKFSSAAGRLRPRQPRVAGPIPGGGDDAVPWHRGENSRWSSE